MPDLDSLLRRGYFPSDLPPAFTPSDFANLIVQNRSLPKVLGSAPSATAQLDPHSIPRVGLSRRTTSLPNPIPFLRLCRELVERFPDILKHCQKSEISCSLPVDNPDKGRAILPEVNFRDMPERRQRIRSSARYILSTDISKFYPSIYTHSIPWAIHGKSEAKARRNDLGLLGNTLDLYVRNCQDGQTTGIPIGPDTSMVIAEAVLSPLDAVLAQQLPTLNALRRVDDYEFAFTTYSDAETALAALEEILQHFELQLNYAKTEIRDLPVPTYRAWVIELATFSIREGSKAIRRDLQHYFSRTYELASIFPEDHVLKYGVARLKSLALNQGVWDLIEDFLFQCLMAEPGTFHPALAQLQNAHRAGLDIDQSRLAAVMNHTIIQHARAGHPSEVAWALWALIYWGASVEGEAARAIGSMEDSVVALLAMDAEARGLIPSGLDRSIWAELMTEGDLYGRRWLLAYEANVKGWLPSQSSGDHVDADAAFGFLKRNGVEFYHADRLVQYRPSFASGAGFEAAEFSPL